MSYLLPINRQLLHLIILLKYLAHRARLDNHAPTSILLLDPLNIATRTPKLEVAVRLCFLLVEHLVDDVRFGGAVGDAIVRVEEHLGEGRLLPLVRLGGHLASLSICGTAATEDISDGLLIYQGGRLLRLGRQGGSWTSGGALTPTKVLLVRRHLGLLLL